MCRAERGEACMLGGVCTVGSLPARGAGAELRAGTEAG